MQDLGLGSDALESVTGLLAGLNAAISRHNFEQGTSSDAGELARAALLESLSVQLRDRLPSLFEPTPQEIRTALASFASGQTFAISRTGFLCAPDLPLARLLPQPRTGQSHRCGKALYAMMRDRVAFERALVPAQLRGLADCRGVCRRLVRQDGLEGAEPQPGQDQRFHPICFQEDEIRAWTAPRLCLSTSSRALRRALMAGVTSNFALTSTARPRPSSSRSGICARACRGRSSRHRD